MTRPCRSDGEIASRCSSTGTATLYGRFATQASGVPIWAGSTCIASASTTVSRSAWLGAYFAIVAGSASASTGSISTAVTR